MTRFHNASQQPIPKIGQIPLLSTRFQHYQTSCSHAWGCSQSTQPTAEPNLPRFLKRWAHGLADPQQLDPVFGRLLTRCLQAGPAAFKGGFDSPEVTEKSLFGLKLLARAAGFSARTFFTSRRSLCRKMYYE